MLTYVGVTRKDRDKKEDFKMHLLVSSDAGSSEIKLVQTNVVHYFPQNTLFIETIQIASSMSLFVPWKLLPN